MDKCEATTNPCFWWDEDRISFPVCSRAASVEIDGVKMCLQHAGTMAVLKLIAIGDAKKLPGVNSGPLCDMYQDKNVKYIKKEK